MNLLLRQFKLQLEQFIASVDLPIEAKRSILNEVYSKVGEQADAEIQKEIAEHNKETEAQTETTEE